MRRLLLGSALALAALSPSFAAPGEDQDLYNTGRSAVFEERWRDARRVFEELSRRFPGSAYSDDARYWLGMALYEMGDAERAYSVLKQLSTDQPESPWNDDARVLMVRCAETALKESGGRGASASLPGGAGAAAEYEDFIERSTRDRSAKVQLLAIDTMLGTNPGKAPELLPRLRAGRGSREAADLVVNRFFGKDRVKVTLENPLLGLREGNVAIMVRQEDQISAISLQEATEMIRSGSASEIARKDPTLIPEIREKLLQAQRNLVREGDPGTVEAIPGAGSGSMSAIVKVVDGEVHYYRNEEETVRIMVLRRDAGYTSENIRIFVDGKAGVRILPLAEARALPAGPRTGLSEATTRWLKAALAIIEIDLTRASGSPAAGAARR